MVCNPPFTYVNGQDLPGVFDDVVSTRIIHLIERINGNAKVTQIPEKVFRSFSLRNSFR